jgi:hypothetical protein
MIANVVSRLPSIDVSPSALTKPVQPGQPFSQLGSNVK